MPVPSQSPQFFQPLSLYGRLGLEGISAGFFPDLQNCCHWFWALSFKEWAYFFASGKDLKSFFQILPVPSQSPQFFQPLIAYILSGAEGISAGFFPDLL